MAKAINTTQAFIKIHKKAAEEYLSGFNSDPFLTMLRAEMYFWSLSSCGTNDYFSIHNMLVNRRKVATRKRYGE